MKLSVVMPSRNQGRYIGAALDSIVQQYRDDNLEVLVRDCLSADETSGILERYSGLPYVKIVSEADHGQSDALKKGFDDARGEVFCWLNSDDVLKPNAVDRVLDTFRARPDADIVFGDALFTDEYGRSIGRFPLSEPTFANLRNRCVLSQPSVFFRKQAYQSVGGLNPSRHFCLDYELWIRFVLNGHRFARIPHVLSATRLHGGTKTFNGGLEFVAEICEMQRSLIGQASPVWRIYERTRSRPFQRFRSKAGRFAVAALAQITRHPFSSPVLVTASIERAHAEMMARLRHMRGS